MAKFDMRLFFFLRVLLLVLLHGVAVLSVAQTGGNRNDQISDQDIVRSRRAIAWECVSKYRGKPEFLK